MRPDKTTECLVCGKLFPRGAVDLARHQSAVTLQHLISEKKSSTFPHACKKCGICFTQEDHLELHKEQSSCNPKVIKARSKENQIKPSKEQEKNSEGVIFCIFFFFFFNEMITNSVELFCRYSRIA